MKKPKYSKANDLVFYVYKSKDALEQVLQTLSLHYLYICLIQLDNCGNIKCAFRTKIKPQIMHNKSNDNDMLAPEQFKLAVQSGRKFKPDDFISYSK